MLARLFNAPEDCESVGTATIGSSEAIISRIGAQVTWRKRRQAEGKPCDNPNIVMGRTSHGMGEKRRYFDVELKLIPLQEDTYIVSADESLKKLTEHICVAAVLGTPSPDR